MFQLQTYRRESILEKWPTPYYYMEMVFAQEDKSIHIFVEAF